MTALFAEYETNKMYHTVHHAELTPEELDNISKKVEGFMEQYRVGTDVLCRVAIRPETPEHVLERLAGLNDANIAAYIAWRESISDKLFEMVLKTGGMVAYHLAGGDNLSKEKEELLLKCGNRVRCRVANLTKNPEIQLILAKDSRSDVRHHLALNHHLSKEAQEILMMDSNVEVRCALVNSSYTHIDVLRYVRDNDTNYEVKRAARNNYTNRSF